MHDPALKSLVDAASAGDSLAVDALLERYLPSVRAYLRLRAGQELLDKESVSDLAQSVCRDVLENLGRFRYQGEEGFRRWLFKTAQRKVADRYEYYRAAKRAPNAGGPRRLGELRETLACYGSIHTPSSHAAVREELERLESAIEQLPDEQRQVVVLARIVGLSRRTIGEELGKSEGAVRMLLHRALARLAERLVAED